MSSNLISTAINSTNSAPYVTSDRTELAPLCSTPQDTKGLRVIGSCMAVFTVLVSMALVTQLHHGHYQVAPHGSVVSDNSECSTVGVSTMRKGGNAVDAVISTLFCLSVVLPHLVGIGGGGYLIIYDQRKRKIVGCLDFQAAVGTTHSSIGVPGFVAGLYQAHKMYGKLPWSVLLNAAIEMAGSGFQPSASVLAAVPLAMGRKDLVDLLTTGHNTQLFTTLQALALNGSDEVYNGSLSSQMAGLVSAEDLAQYEVVTDTCVEKPVGQYHVAVAGPSSGGPLLLQLLEKINLRSTVEPPVLSVALNLKETMLVSRPYSSGVNVVATDHNDIYVAAVSGLGSVLGSLELTPGGYIMNNNNVFSSAHMAEDSRSPTLASPIIVTQAGSACGNRFIMGASDVRDAAQLLVAVLHSANNSSLQALTDSARARVTTSQILLERNHQPLLDSEQLLSLQALGYVMGNASEPYPSLNIIHKVGDTVTAVADSRGGGSPASF